MADLRTKILDFGGFDSSRILTFKGRNSQAYRGFSGKFESRNLSRDNPSREIGRSIFTQLIQEVAANAASPEISIWENGPRPSLLCQ